MTPPEERDELARFRNWVRDVSVAFVGLSGGGSEMFTRIGDEFYVDPEPCAQRIKDKIDAARQLRRTPDSGREVGLEEAASVADAVAVSCQQAFEAATLPGDRNCRLAERNVAQAIAASIRLKTTPSPITPDPDEPCPKCDDSGYIEYSGGGIWTGENVTIRQELCDCPCGQDAARQFAKPATPDPEIVRAVEAEREACAALAEEMGDNSPQFIADAISSLKSPPAPSVEGDWKRLEPRGGDQVVQSSEGKL